MIEWSTLRLFVAAALVLLLTPGPAVLYIVARSIHQGRGAGLVSAVGVGVGNGCQVIAATLGISAILLSSALAFHLLKYAGAAYLLYLGIRTLLAQDDSHQQTIVASRSLSRIFWQGVLVNIFNPKTALFFFAFLPQFVDPARGDIAGQILLLGGLFVGMGVCSDGLYAMLAGAMGRWLRGSRWFGRARRYGSGSIYVALGVTTALATPDP
jgi:threonine/homoserine/homoserine lactone efflux protein